MRSRPKLNILFMENITRCVMALDRFEDQNVFFFREHYSADCETHGRLCIPPAAAYDLRASCAFN